MHRILQFLHHLRPIRYYAVAMLLLFAAYVWAALSGTRMLGDDNATTETRSGASGNHFYHK